MLALAVSQLKVLLVNWMTLRAETELNNGYSNNKTSHEAITKHAHHTGTPHLLISSSLFREHSAFPSYIH